MKTPQLPQTIGSAATVIGRVAPAAPHLATGPARHQGSRSVVNLAPRQPTLKREVLLARHGWPGGAENLACPGSPVGEHVDRHGRERLGLRDVRQSGVDDLVIGAVAAAGGAA